MIYMLTLLMWTFIGMATLFIVGYTVMSFVSSVLEGIDKTSRELPEAFMYTYRWIRGQSQPKKYEEMNRKLREGKRL